MDSPSPNRPIKRGRSTDETTGESMLLRAREIIQNQLEACYFIGAKHVDESEIDQILGEMIVERDLPVIRERDEKYKKLLEYHQSEVEVSAERLKEAVNEGQKQATLLANLQDKMSWFKNPERYNGAGAAIITLSAKDSTRLERVNAWTHFRPYARNYLGKLDRVSLSARSLSLPSASFIKDQLALTRGDKEDDNRVPPGLLGGDATDEELVTSLLELESNDLARIIDDAEVSYPQELLQVLLRRLQYSRPIPRPESFFPSDNHRIFDFPSDLNSNYDIFYQPEFSDRIVVGILDFGVSVNVYSWHPLEKLLVVYTWPALEEVNVETPFGDEEVRAVLEARLGIQLKDALVQHRQIFRSTCIGHVGPLTVKLVSVLLNSTLPIDMGIAMSSSALFSARSPSSAEILRLRLEQLGDLAHDFALSRELWSQLLEGRLM